MREERSAQLDFSWSDVEAIPAQPRAQQGPNTGNRSTIILEIAITVKVVSPIKALALVAFAA